MAGKALVMTLVAALGAFARREEPKIVEKLDGFRYPPIAVMARIQGDVVFTVSPDGSKLISSANPLLTPAAADNLKNVDATSARRRVPHHVPLSGP